LAPRQLQSLSTAAWTAAAARASGQDDSGRIVPRVVLVTVLVVAAGPVVVVGVTDVVDVVVGVWPVTDTAQPVPVAGVIGMASVSYR